MPDSENYTANILLNLLSREDLELLQPNLSRVDIARQDVLVYPDTPIAHVYSWRVASLPPSPR